MTQTVIAWGDPKAVKKWSANLAVDTLEKAYFNAKFIGTGANNVIEEKKDLESEAGDRVSFDLSVQLRKSPTSGDARVKGNGENLKFFTDEIIIDQVRHEVSAGGRMSRKRTLHDMRKVGRDRLGDYWGKWVDELMFMYLAGARGINEDFIEPSTYTGHAGNPLRSPDAQHQMYGGSATSKGTLATTDKMTRTLIERAVTRARMMRAKDPETANMVPIKIGSQEHYTCVMSPYQEHDLRTVAGETGWLEIQKAASGADGKSNKLFTGGLGMINNCILHSHPSVVRFNNYGAGADVEAARAMFMGRQAGVYACGMKNGRFDWKEEMEDRGNEPVITAGTIIGFSKTRFNGRDFGIMALDTAAAESTG